MVERERFDFTIGLFFPYGQANAVANANGSQASSSNFNPLVAAVGFNPLAGGYPGAAAAAFYSSPFSMLPFAAAAAAAAATSNAQNSAPFLNAHGPTNLLSAGFQPAANRKCFLWAFYFAIF